MALTKRAIQVQLEKKLKMNNRVMKIWRIRGNSVQNDVKAYLWISAELQEVFLIVELSELAGPRPHSSDVQAQGLFMRS